MTMRVMMSLGIMIDGLYDVLDNVEYGCGGFDGHIVDVVMMVQITARVAIASRTVHRSNFTALSLPSTCHADAHATACTRAATRHSPQQNRQGSRRRRKYDRECAVFAISNPPPNQHIFST